ncbi:hypothetical protein [Marivita sp. GX14005]|uniref:hypothetical protein n=1 Tax=Marivita sp. GX14005 TaxID=2942276 RepID=UPI0020188162|nr:hypothetical protein [Marivita sp. GX14005]MCL3881554.1 hypothetical protein [Marivita sp. GX14005]
MTVLITLTVLAMVGYAVFALSERPRHETARIAATRPGADDARSASFRHIPKF